MQVWDNYVESAAADVSAPGSNAAAVVTYASAASQARHVVSGVAWSYSGTPTGGLLTIGNGTEIYFSMDITTAGAGLILFPRPKAARRNDALVVTLAAGGTGVTGKVSVLNHWVE